MELMGKSSKRLSVHISGYAIESNVWRTSSMTLMNRAAAWNCLWNVSKLIDSSSSETPETA
jgi:hypothetical protein